MQILVEITDPVLIEKLERRIITDLSLEPKPATQIIEEKDNEQQTEM